MLDDAQRAQVEELVGRLVPGLVAAEVARLVPKLVAEQVAVQLAEQLAALGVAPSPPPQTDRVPHTAWEGDRDLDFVFDPPRPRRHTLLVARGTSSRSSAFYVRQFVRSETSARTVADEFILSHDGSPEAIFVSPVRPTATRNPISGRGSWRTRTRSGRPSSSFPRSRASCTSTPNTPGH